MTRDMTQDFLTKTSDQTSYRVLARQYRPQKLSELVGQDLLVDTLTQGIERNRLPHAFLLHGIRGVGKTTTARILAKALNCIGQDGLGGPTPNPCGICESCLAISEDRHLDVLEMDAASRTGVDDIREVIEAARYKAVKGRYKIYIIDEVHMLSKSAFNALLKTLEEPPPHVKFIFATTEIRKLPETVLSRCMRFDLKRIDPKSLFDHFQTILQKENLQIEEEALSLIVRAADGSARDGLSLLDQAISLSQEMVTTKTVYEMLGLTDRGQLFDLLKTVLQGKIKEALMQTQDLYHKGGDPVIIMEDLLNLVYWLTCLKTAPHLAQDTTWPERDRSQGMEMVHTLSLPSLMRVWQVLHKGYEEVVRSPLPTQALEMVLVRVGYLSDLPQAEDLLAALHGVQKSPSIPSSSVSSFAATAPALSEKPKIQPMDLPVNRDIKEATSSIPEDFPSLLEMLQNAKEALLYGHIIQDVHLISYQPKALTIRLAETAPKTLSTQLRQALEKITATPWTIEVLQTGGAPTLAQQKKQAQEERIKASQEHPLVKTLMEQFPGATITSQ